MVATKSFSHGISGGESCNSAGLIHQRCAVDSIDFGGTSVSLSCKELFQEELGNGESSRNAGANSSQGRLSHGEPSGAKITGTREKRCSFLSTLHH